MSISAKLNVRYFEIPARRPSGCYVRLGPIRMYYETYGHGKPLLLLHGGLSAIEGLRYQIPFFAKHFKVILPERPGHGRTADIAGAYHYEQMAWQTAAFMDALKLKQARLMGHSDGANLLFWLAAHRRDLVERFIAVGGNFNYRGCEPLFQKELKKQKIQLDPRYAALSPDGANHYPVVFEKCRKLWLSEPKWKAGLLRKIKTPALITVGDRDMIQHQHTLAMYRALPHAQLAMVPGTSHGLLKEKPKLVNAMMLNFLQQKFN